MESKRISRGIMRLKPRCAAQEPAALDKGPCLFRLALVGRRVRSNGGARGLGMGARVGACGGRRSAALRAALGVWRRQGRRRTARDAPGLVAHSRRREERRQQRHHRSSSAPRASASLGLGSRREPYVGGAAVAAALHTHGDEAHPAQAAEPRRADAAGGAEVGRAALGGPPPTAGAGRRLAPEGSAAAPPWKQEPGEGAGEKDAVAAQQSSGAELDGASRRRQPTRAWAPRQARLIGGGGRPAAASRGRSPRRRSRAAARSSRRLHRPRRHAAWPQRGGGRRSAGEGPEVPEAVACGA